jgi:hypothetical protein
MEELMAAQEKALQVQPREQMIDVGHRLGHSVVIGILGLECEFLKTVRQDGGKAVSIAADASIRPDSPQSGVSVPDQAQADITIDIAVGRALLRRAIDSSYKVVVHERGADTELTLFQSQYAMVVPGRLPKSGERHRMLPRSPA